jgi:ElaB/YqjD/DUF883 family membrane-anchored ribosome-binding protein
VRDDTSGIDRIEHELAATRARLDGTIDALQQKLSPGELMSQAVTYFKEGSGMDLGQNLGRSLRDNPVPVALIGLGLGWLVTAGSRRLQAANDSSRQGDTDMHGRREFRSDAYRYALPGRVPETAAHRSMPYEPMLRDDLAGRIRKAADGVKRASDEDDATFQERVATAKGAIVGVTRQIGEAAAVFRERVEETVATASESTRRAGREALAFAGNAGTTAGDMAGGLVERGEAGLRSAYDYGRSSAHGMREGADHAMNWAQDLGSRTTSYLQEQPLLLGALGVTLGAALGMLLPSSRYEREMLGGVREGLRDTAAEAVRDVRDRAVRVAETVVDTAQDATRGKDLSDPAPAYVAAAARGPVADTASRVGDAVAETATNGGAAAEQEGVSPDAQERAPAPRH